ncbi:hypothetical protein [Aeromonas enteropelogenes]|uniref:hypothetical protein n=1 Tax=Aeromonas enteropelogenes TaxID=29489 RepID=UPI003BA3CAE3
MTVSLSASVLRLLGPGVDRRELLAIDRAQKIATKKAKQAAAVRQLVATQLQGLPECVTEVKFHPRRKWRLDYAWPAQKVALEVHGGIRSGGRHTRGDGFTNDREKMNEAALLGWLVIEATTEQIRSGQARAWLERALDETRMEDLPHE